jgi:hypothetical protein
MNWFIRCTSIVAAGVTAGLAVAGDPVQPGVLASWGNTGCCPPKDLGRVRDVAGGYSGYGPFTLAVAESGFVAYWGDSPSVGNIPNDLGACSAVAAGRDFAVALTVVGTVRAWGYNHQGQCNVPADLGTSAAVAAGESHTVALRSDGGVRAWGNNGSGQCNIPADLGACTAIAAGGYHTVALRQGGSVQAWGNAGDGATDVPTDLGPSIAITAGGFHTVALRSDGRVRAWGYNGNGECNVPADLGTCTAIAAGQNHTIALRQGGSVRAWGSTALVPPNLSPAIAIRSGSVSYGSYAIQTPDCNNNGTADADEIAANPALDCNGNLRLDACDISLGSETDVNANGTPDSCEVDCDNDGLPDSYEIAGDPSLDCDGNGTIDTCQPVPPPHPGAQQWPGTSGGNNHWYWVDNTPRTFAQAVARAEALGARLLTVGSSSEWRFVRDSFGWNWNTRFAWVGATQATKGAEPGGGWSWIDGQPISPNTWAPGEPNNLGGNDDVAVGDRDAYSDFYLHDSRPDALRPSIFEWELSDDCNGNGQRDYCEIAAGAPDCNQNGKPDACDFEAGGDCDGNGLLDACEIASGTGLDCNGNGRFDYCDLAAGSSTDLDGNNVPDECQADCNGNGIPDVIDILQPGTDCNHDNRLDDCQGFTDCDNDGLRDWCEIDAGTEGDCNGNDDIDRCEFAGDPSFYDCDGNGVFDACDLANGTAPDCNGNGNIDSCDIATGFAEDCDGNGQPDVCQKSSSVTLTQQAGPIGAGVSATIRFPAAPQIVQLYGESVRLLGDFDQVMERVTIRLGSATGPVVLTQLGANLPFGTCIEWIADFAEDWPSNQQFYADLFNAYIQQHGSLDFHVQATLAVDPQACAGTSFVRMTLYYVAATAADCNGNGLLDTCEIAAGLAEDCEGNGIPDQCEYSPADCDGDGTPDACALAKQLVPDCNANAVPDSCDVAAGTSADIDLNGVPDECKPDCDGDGLPDPYEIATGLETDCNGNLVPDQCDLAAGGLDCDGNGRLDSCDVAAGSTDANGNGIPDSCECLADIAADGMVNGADLALVLVWWNNPAGFPAADINHDGSVNGADLAALLTSWGPCPN